MPTMYKELVGVLHKLVEFECACEDLEDCSECCLRGYSGLCEVVPTMIETIQMVLVEEC